ncbi:hypothetical protein VNO80_09301 [Phaseolus coccineus]|uniref:DUF4005 domain-containing protein n=1 Tax=Phaseolus coccineus TaxID=3886 RepID=A0AAN9RCK3_PHACN
MAVTESNKTKMRSVSTPKQRTGILDICSNHNEPHKEGISFYSFLLFREDSPINDNENVQSRLSVGKNRSKKVESEKEHSVRRQQGQECTNLWLAFSAVLVLVYWCCHGNNATYTVSALVPGLKLNPALKLNSQLLLHVLLHATVSPSLITLSSMGHAAFKSVKQPVAEQFPPQGATFSGRKRRKAMEKVLAEETIVDLEAPEV